MQMSYFWHEEQTELLKFLSTTTEKMTKLLYSVSYGFIHNCYATHINLKHFLQIHKYTWGINSTKVTLHYC